MTAAILLKWKVWRLLFEGVGFLTETRCVGTSSGGDMATLWRAPDIDLDERQIRIFPGQVGTTTEPRSNIDKRKRKRRLIRD
jgi:hypothetical protein